MFSNLLKNVWFIAFAIVTVLLIVAAVILGITLGNGDEAPEYTEGAEVGVYYYDVTGGEILLTLSGGNKFTIAGPGMNKTGTYVANESGLVLDYIRDEDGEATAVVNGENITVTFADGSTMNFLKKVNYTVSYNVDGGSAVNAATVVNGKTTSKPADPTKEGYVFLGWYADEACTVPFAFDTVTVKADTTVYAKWAQKGAIGSPEYDIAFDLGYTDAPALETLTTIGQKAYGVAAPEREGYTFGGWWISMYEDAAKLSYAYTEDFVFNKDTTLYAVWYDNASTKLIAPKASVAKNSVKWESVSGAISYNVVITDANGAEVANENVGTTTYTFNFDNYPAGEYTVSVTAVGADSSKNSEAAVRSFANKTLDMVNEFTVINGILIYNSVAGAEKYYVTVDCGNPAHKHTAFDNGSSTVFSIANCSMQKGGIKITVTASAKGYADSVSKTFVYERNLSAVAGVTYDAANDAFVWFPVENATSYYVELTDGTNTYKVNIGNKTSFSLANYSGELSIKVTPITDGYNSPDAATASFTKVIPAAPTGLTVSGNNVSWNAIEGATSYTVKVGNTTVTTDTNTYNIAGGDVVLVPGDYYSISVQAITANGASSFCPAVNMGYLVMDGVLNYSANTVSWTPVIGASNYLVRVNGGETISVNGTSTKVKLTKSGINTIEVKYTDLGGSKWVSLEVYAYAVTYVSRSLSGDYTEYVAIGDIMTLPTTFENNGYDFDGWYNTPGAADGNGKKINVADFNYTSDVVLYANWAPKTYKVELQTNGYDITNITDKTKADATFTTDFVLPVPVTGESNSATFLGWYTQPAGEGTQLTDEDGNSIEGYPFAADSVAYPFYDTGVLQYSLKKDGTYAVRAGKLINKVKNITIPEYYNGAKVTTVLENGFADCTRLVNIEIPDTIELIGTGAFSGCTRLQSITIYEVEGNHERFYSSDDGVLVRHDLGTNYLEVVPRAKTGTYVMNETINVIRNKAFNFSNLNSVVISKSVTTVASRAFNYCSNLESIDFIEGRTSSITFEDDSFYRCNNVKFFKVPAAIENININMLQSLTALSSIAVEAGHINYGSVAGLLTNNLENTIVFVPAAFVTGDFTIPSGIQYIGERAFENCSGITSITIPNFVKSIGASAFRNCSGMKNITFAGDRKQNDLDIGEYAFAYNSKLLTVTFGGSADGTLDGGAFNIGAYAFVPVSANDAKLTTVTFGNGANVTAIGTGAFQNQAILSAVNFNNASVLSIGDYAFSGCRNLGAMVIPASTTKVGAYAFQNCTGITTLSIADGSQALTFGNYAFTGCSKLTEINLPASVSSFDGSVFGGCNALKTINVAPENTHLKSIEGVLYNAAVTELIFFPTARVAELNGAIAKENLPDTLVKIGAAVFSGNNSLKSIVIQKGVREIGDNAFYNCVNLTSITFESSEATDAALTIGNNAFYKCAFTDISTLPEYTTRIGDYAFYGSKFASFPAPDALTYIGTYAFNGNTALSSFTIPAKVSAVGDGAFSGCTSLNTLNIEGGDVALTLGTDNASTYTAGVFYRTKISTLELPDRVTKIGAYAFAMNSTSTSYNKLTTFKAGANLQSIGYAAFYQSVALNSITLNEGLVTINAHAFGQTSALDTVNIPSTVTNIGSYAFGSSSSWYKTASTITFAPGGTDPIVIAANAFRYAKITEFTIPARAIAYVEGLENTLYNIAESNGLIYKTFADIFADCSNLANIYVEEGSNQFTSIKGIVYTGKMVGDDPATAVFVPTALLYCPQKNEGVAGVVTIPNTVELVEDGAFYNTSKITKVIFEEFDENDERYATPILQLGNYVPSSKNNTSTEKLGIFAGSSNTIAEIHLPSHLAYIGSCAFNITKQEVVLDFNPKANGIELARYAFYKVKVDKLNLPGIANIPVTYYMYQVPATEITFGANSTFTTLSNYGIYKCNNLTTFEIPKNVTYIASAAFLDSANIETITFAEGNKLLEIGSIAFDGMTSLKNFTIPSTVTAIGNSAFNETLITSVTIPAGVTSLSAATFAGCNLTEVIVDENNANYKSIDGVVFDKNVTTIYYYPVAKEPAVVNEVATYTIPETVVAIADSAFEGYKGTAIVLPAELTSIGISAFKGAAITEITIPAKIVNIGMTAFMNCVDLVTFTMDPNAPITAFATYSPSGYILDGVFDGCASLKNVTLSDNITSLGAHAFEGCSSLETIILPSALTIIENHVFNYCNNLISVNIPDGVESIGNQAFAANTYTTEEPKLESLTIPASVTFIDNNAFIYQKNLKHIIFEADSLLQSIGNTPFSGCVSLESLDLSVATNLQTIGTNLFKGCTAIESVNLSGTQIKNIPTGTFADCTSLTEVKLPSDLETIAANAYYNATALESVVIPASVTSIGTSAFENCTSLKTVEFESGSAITALGTTTTANDNIFKNTTSLETLILPTGLETIGGHVFENSGVKYIYQNNGIMEVSLPTALTSIGDYAFANCDGLVDVVIIGNVSYVGNYAFNDCAGLTNLTLSDGISYIGTLAFGYCTSLTSVKIPQSVTRLEGNPFSGCSGITNFELDENNVAYKFVDGVLYDFTMYTLICLPASLTDTSFTLPVSVYEIAGGAFAGSHIESITIPNRITTIPDYAFADCLELESVTIPNSVTNIGAHAFDGCDVLNNVRIPASVVTLGDYAFANCIALTDFEFAEKNTATDTAYSIGSHFFEGCTAMTEIILPNYMTNGTKIPAYMYANTGVVNPVVPEQITSMNSTGVFANNPQLETVTFEGVSFFTSYIGSRYFENCTSLKTIIDGDDLTQNNMAPIVNSYAFAGCTSLEVFTLYGNDGYSAVESYGFAGCTGLKNFYFTTGDNYGTSSYDHLADYAFKDCTGIEVLYLPGGTADGYDVYYKNVFDGWTANQTIIFLNDLEGFPRYGHSGYSLQYLDGCDAKIVWQDEFFSTEVVELLFFAHFESGELMNYAETVKTLNIYDIGFNHNDSQWGKKSLYSSVFKYWTADQTINFKNYSYTEIIGFFDANLFDVAAFKDCAAKVCDKDGNVLVIDVATGAITSVTNADGSTVLWTPAT